MSDQQQSGADLFPQAEQQFDDSLAGIMIEIAGGFVGQKQFRLWCDGAGKGHALLLAAGKLRGIMRQPVIEADITERRGRDAEGVRDSGKLKRHGHVLDRVHGGDEMKRLEHDADLLPAEKRQRILVHRRNIRSTDTDLPRCGAFQPGEEQHQGGLAGARRADQANRLTRRNLEVDAVEDIDLASGAAQFKGNL